MKARAKTIEIDGIGQILFERSKKARHINISVKPFKGVRVAIPYGVSYDKAKQVAKSKKSWIQKHLNKMKHVKKEHEALPKNLTEIDRNKARKKLVGRLNELSEQHGFSYNKVLMFRTPN